MWRALLGEDAQGPRRLRHATCDLPPLAAPVEHGGHPVLRLDAEVAGGSTGDS
jgi:hypothetical protein